jgi:hypothetical protein
MSVVDVREPVRSDLDELRTSARGWHGVQLAVLGFIGLCGALESGDGGSGPDWLEQLAAVLVLAALAVACLATVLVAGAAWPVNGWRHTSTADGTVEAEVRRDGRHLRTGIVLTFVAVGLVALATSSSWWPTKKADGGLVEVSTAQGTICGTLLGSQDGALAIEVSGQRLVVPMSQLAGLRPTTSCSP